MHNLKNATFIIPVRLESDDRKFNLETVLNHLCRNLETNIMIYESGPEPLAHEILAKVNPVKCIIAHKYENHIGPFHRTRILNEMLAACKTNVVVNYDCDILLEPDTYLLAYNMIEEMGHDLVYPYFQGFSQICIHQPKPGFDFIGNDKINRTNWTSDCGHCQFFKRSSYIEGGMENEDFISYGPEDVERKERFIKLGYNVAWLPDNYVYHLEHERGADSSKENKHFVHNEALYNKLKNYSKEELQQYYAEVEYLKKYKMKKIVLLTYADQTYSTRRDKLVIQATELNTIDKSIEWDRKNITSTEFYNQNKKILDEETGAGYWAWKPYIILNALQSLKEDEILLYMDSGDFITNNLRIVVNNLMSNNDIYLLKGGYPNYQYTNLRCFETMMCNEEKYLNVIQVEAGVCLFKKSEKSIAFVTEWLNYCLMWDAVADDDNRPQHPGFIEHRRDQSILTNLMVKHDIPYGSELRNFIICNYH